MGVLSKSEWASWSMFFEGTFSSPWYNKHQTELLGVLLAAASNLLMSVALSIQKCAHLRLARQAELKPFYRSELWWCGAALLGLGELCNFTAYGFAPIALIAPLGCVSIIGSAFISVLFLKKTVRAADIVGGSLAVVGMYLLVTFAPNVPQELTARRIQKDLVSWTFLVYVINLSFPCQKKREELESPQETQRYQPDVPGMLLEVQANPAILEIIIFCILLYFYKIKAVKHVVVLLMMVALLASLTVITVKAVASMIMLSAKGKMQLTYPVFYIMLILMAISCVFQVNLKCTVPITDYRCIQELMLMIHHFVVSPMAVRGQKNPFQLSCFALFVVVVCTLQSQNWFLNQAVHLYEARTVVPINFVFCTTSAIISGVIFYQEFQSAAFLSVFMFLFGCLLSFLSVFVIAVNKKEEHLQVPYIDCGCIPGQKLTGKIQPDSYGSCYGTLNNKDDSGKSQS